MAWNGTGTYIQVTPVSSGVSAWTDAKAAGDVNITTSDHDYHDQDVANGISNCIAKDGQNAATANLPMGGFRHTGVGDAVSNTDYASLAQLILQSSVVGGSRNAAMAVAAASSTATFTADQVIVAGTLAGRCWRLASVNKGIDLTTTGLGGMDSGTAPLTGYVAIYVMYNPATLDVGLLATDATSAIQPEAYSGGSRPAGYTGSALVAVWPTDGSGKLIAGFMVGRTLQTALRAALTNSATQHAGLTALAISGSIPRNAKTVSGFFIQISTISSTLSVGLAGASYVGAYQYVFTGSQFDAAFTDMPLVTPVTLYYIATVSSGTMGFSLNICGYSF